MRNNIKIIYLAGFLFTMTLAMTSYINSSFLQVYLNEYYVGIIYIVASIVTILGLLQMPKILTVLGNRRTTLVFSLIALLSLISLSYNGNAYIVVFGFIIYFVSTTFVITSLDIFIEAFSKNSSIGKFRGLYLVVINSAWVIAQLFSGEIILRSSFSGIYYISAIFMILVVVIFILYMHDFKDPKYIKVPVKKTIKLFSSNKNLMRVIV